MVSAGQATDDYSAVYFVEGGQVARQVSASEFGAFLDGYAGLSDLAETNVKAVWVELSGDLRVRALVFFRIWFDEEGRADGDWSVPIEALAARGAKGPDMGGGAIRLVCRSQCPEPQHVSELWDPDTEHFQVIRKAVDANALKFRHIQPEEESEIPVLRAGEEALSDAQREQELEVQALRDDLAKLERKYEDLRLSNEQLKRKEPSENFVMSQLKAQNVFLVAYHSGLGHVTLPYDEINTYFVSPTAYAAEHCGIDEACYLQWLEHYETPVCQYALEAGGHCDDPLFRVSQPGGFRPGIDDRCENHQL